MQKLSAFYLFFTNVVILTSRASAALNLQLPTPPVKVVNEGITHGEVICPDIGATGQGGSAEYFFSLIAVSPDPGFPSPFELVQGVPSDSNTAEIRVVVPPGLDYEAENQYMLSITVTDHNDTPSVTVTGTLTVDITDDPESPYFTNLPGQGSIGESVTIPETFKLVTVMDDDSPPTDVTVSIAGSEPFGAPFQIGAVNNNPNSTVAEIQNAPYPGFDYETQFGDVYKLFIEATDGSFTATSTLSVTIFDENEPVRITNLPDTITVPENAVGGVFLVEWDDEDIFDGGTPTFTISTVPSGGPFSVDTSGNVKIVSPGLDYLSNDHWTVNIYIEDPDGLTDNGQLHIIVTDVNQGPEIVNMPAGITVQVGELSSAGSDIFTVDAFDEDADEYFCVMFANPNDGNFVINSTTYVISVIDEPSLDYETTPTYTLTVTCHDNQNTGLAKNLIVEILNENESPEILNLPATVTVPEDAINTAPIFIADGYDVDGDLLSYTIAVSPESGHSKFTVTNTTANDAKISIVNNPGFDFEVADQYVITLEASDGVLTATGTLNVDLVDIDEPPRFVNNDQEVLINEGQPTETPISVDWSVIDVDDPIDSLVFDMIGGTYTTYFTLIGGPNPELQIAQVMDYEANFPAPINILFSVSDPAGGRDYLSLKVFLLDVNDNAPVFSQPQYIGSLYEMEPYGASVLRVSATDNDVGDTISYYINPENPYFDVDPQSGDVTVKQSIDRETVGDTVTLTVFARDNGSTSLEGSASVQITVIDINDNDPLFENDFWNWEIRYDADVASYVNSVRATDADADNGVITYKTYLGSPYFAIEDDGQVYITNTLEPNFMYTLICRAYDDGNPTQMSRVALIRIDTYIPRLVLVNVYVGTSLTDFTSTRRQEFINALNGVFHPWYFRIASFRSSTDQQASRRRLLQEAVVIEMYALTNNHTEYHSNVGMVKEFLDSGHLVSAMTVHSDGTPSDIVSVADFDNFPVVRVEPTYGAAGVDWWLDTREGNATIGAMTLVLLLMLVLFVYFCCWKHQCWRSLTRLCSRRGSSSSWKSQQKKVEVSHEKPRSPVAWEEGGAKRPTQIPLNTISLANRETFEFRYGKRPHYTVLDSKNGRDDPAKESPSNVDLFNRQMSTQHSETLPWQPMNKSQHSWSRKGTAIGESHVPRSDTHIKAGEIRSGSGLTTKSNVSKGSGHSPSENQTHMLIHATEHHPATLTHQSRHS